MLLLVENFKKESVLDAKKRLWGSALLLIAFVLTSKHVSASEKEVVYRLYNPNSGEHFYTTSFYEQNTLKNVGWRDEGVG